jgi:outer membrane lipoprotein-sorting protein
MKSFYSLIFTIFILVQAVSAQKDPKALEILNAMSEKYKSIPAYKANFEYTLNNPNEGINEDMRGEIVVKGEKFRLKLGGQEIINNGETVWTYLAEANEVNIDNYNPNEGDMNPSTMYSAYREGYKYVFLEDRTEEGSTVSVVDLIPEARNTQFFKVRMKIDKKDKTLKSWEMFDAGGNVYSHKITNFDPNVNVDNKFFEFDKSKYKGVEIIDLR